MNGVVRQGAARERGFYRLSLPRGAARRDVGEGRNVVNGGGGEGKGRGKGEGGEGGGSGQQVPWFAPLANVQWTPIPPMVEASTQ